MVVFFIKMANPLNFQWKCAGKETTHRHVSPMGHVVYLDFIFVSAALPCVNI